MAGTSQKHRDFVAEPMGEKTVQDLPGIGEALGARLRVAGFERAYKVLGQYLILEKDEEMFTDWLKDVCDANAAQARQCYNGLNDWCEEFL